MNAFTRHRRAHLKLGNARAALVIAKLAHDKAKAESKADRKNDEKRYKFQDAVGRLYRAEKSVWMKASQLPK